MDHQSAGYLQYPWLSPTMRAVGQSHQTLQHVPHQHSYHAPFPDHIYPSQYYHANHQPLSPDQKHSQMSSWSTTPTLPHDPSQLYLEYPPLQYPSSPPNLFQHTHPFRLPTQQPPPFINSNHTGYPRKVHHSNGKNSFQNSITY